LVLAVERHTREGRQSFVVPDRVSNIEEALVGLSEFAPRNGAGSYRWDASLHRWVPDGDDLAGSLVPRRPPGDPPHASAARA
jgi:hypothetical protein